jgi:Carboxypeptidase regulatory-like domain
MRAASVVAFCTMAGIGVAFTPVAAFSDTAPPASVQGPAVSSEAPVDDYFGHFGQSVLEIRNRIGEIQSEADATLRTADGVGAIEHIEDAVAAWKSQYPHDPWLAAVLAHLFECYVRAGQAHSAHATAMLESLIANFPDSKEADEALRAFAKSDLPGPVTAAAAQPVTTDVAGRVIDAATSLPVAGALVWISDGASNDPVSVPFATSAADGTFKISGVTSQAKYVVVAPPHGSSYAASKTPFVAAAGSLVVKLAAPALAANAIAKP